MTLHGNTDHKVAGFGNKAAHAETLRTDDNGHRAGEISLIQGRGAVCCSAIDPDALILEGFDGGSEITDPGHRHILHRTGGSLGYHSCKTGISALGNDNAVGAGTFCRSQDCAKIVGIGDLVANHDKRCLSPFLCDVDDVRNGAILPGSSHGDHALMGPGLTHGVQLPPVAVGYHSTGLFCKRCDVAKGAVRIAGSNEHLVNGASGYNTSINEERNKGAFVMDAEAMDIDRLLSRSQSLAQSKGKGGDK